MRHVAVGTSRRHKNVVPPDPVPPPPKHPKMVTMKTLREREREREKVAVAMPCCYRLVAMLSGPPQMLEKHTCMLLAVWLMSERQRERRQRSPKSEKKEERREGIRNKEEEI